MIFFYSVIVNIEGPLLSFLVIMSGRFLLLQKEKKKKWLMRGYLDYILRKLLCLYRVALFLLVPPCIWVRITYRIPFYILFLFDFLFINSHFFYFYFCVFFIYLNLYHVIIKFVPLFVPIYI